MDLSINPAARIKRTFALIGANDNGKRRLKRPTRAYELQQHNAKLAVPVLLASELGTRPAS